MTEATLAALIQSWGALILLPLAILEGPIVTLVAGALWALGLLAPLPALVALIAGDLIGDTVLYSVGRWFRHSPLPWPFRRPDKRLPPRRWAAILADMRRRDIALMLFGKFAQAPGAAILLAAGVARVPFERFLAVNLGATLVKTSALLLLGRVLGTSATLALGWIGWAGLAACVLALTLLAVHLARRTRVALS